MNVCLSYGSRAEIVTACRRVVQEVELKNITVMDIDEKVLTSKMCTENLPGRNNL